MYQGIAIASFGKARKKEARRRKKRDDGVAEDDVRPHRSSIAKWNVFGASESNFIT